MNSEHGHVIGPRTYILVFLSLMALTAVTIAAAFVDMGPMNIVAAVTIAVVKATLVLLYFMHVRYSDYLPRIFLGAGLFWFLILMALTLGDYLTRHLFRVGGW